MELDQPDDPEVCFRRAFHWGILIVVDAGSRRLPDLEPGQAVSWGDDAFVVTVRHAHDVEWVGLADDELIPLAEVEVRVHLGVPAPEGVPEGVIAVPSGRIELGDEDSSHQIDVALGRWRAVVQQVPSDDAELVELWFSPVDVQPNDESGRRRR